MGLFSRRGPALPPLTPAPRVADLPAPLLRHAGRYLGTLAGQERIRSRGLGSASAARIQLSEEGVDVIRLAGSFRIPADQLRSARGTMDFDQRAGGSSEPGKGALVIRWQHGEQVLDTGFRLEADAVRERSGRQRTTDTITGGTHREWSRAVAKIGRNHDG